MKLLLLIATLAALTLIAQAQRPQVRLRPPLQPVFSACDVNRDGLTNVADLQIVIDELEGFLPYTASADINGDGEITVADFQLALNAALGFGCFVAQ